MLSAAARPLAGQTGSLYITWNFLQQRCALCSVQCAVQPPYGNIATCAHLTTLAQPVIQQLWCCCNAETASLACFAIMQSTPCCRLDLQLYSVSILGPPHCTLTTNLCSYRVKQNVGTVCKSQYIPKCNLWQSSRGPIYRFFIITSYHDKLGNGQNAETGIVGMYEYVDVCPTLVKL